jgi:hypothetical protein
MEPLTLLRLGDLASRTRAYVGVLFAAQKKVVRGKTQLVKKHKLKKKFSLKRALQGHTDEDERDHLATLQELSDRVAIHERLVSKMTERLKRSERETRGLRATGNIVYLEPLFREVAINAFCECDDWANLARGSV